MGHHRVGGRVQLAEDPAQRAPDDLGVQDLLLDGLQDRLVGQIHREDQPSGTDGAPAQVMVAAQVGIGSATPRRSAVDDQAARRRARTARVPVSR